MTARRPRNRASCAIASASRSPATSAESIAIAETVSTELATTDSLMLASSSSFSSRVMSRVRSPVSWTR